MTHENPPKVRKLKGNVRMESIGRTVRFISVSAPPPSKTDDNISSIISPLKITEVTKSASALTRILRNIRFI